MTDDVQQLLAFYPRIYFACHARHRRDPGSQQVLSAHQASILDHLDDTTPLTLKDLAQHLGVTPSTMSLAVDRLERGGWVSRQRDPGDGRRMNLRLTSAGARMKAAQSVLDPERVAAMLARLAAPQRRAALAGLALLAEAAGQEVAAWTAER